MLRATLRSLLARKLRLLLSAAAVVAGVSFVAGTLVLTDTLNNTFTSLFAGITRNVSVDVRAVNKVAPASDAGRASLPATLLAAVQQAAQGAGTAVPEVRGSLAPIDPRTGKPAGSASNPGIGMNWTGGEPTSVETVAAGRAPAGDGDVALDLATADRLGLRVGDQVKVSGTATGTFTLVGTFRIDGQDGLAGTPVTAFTLAEAQRMILAPDQLTAIYVAARPGVSQADLAARIARVLPATDEAITGHQLADEQASTVKQALSFLSTALLIFAGISVFVGAFIIFNTFTMLVAQRVRELALLRAIGASRSQVRLSVQVEAALVGFVGSTVGLALGVGLARVLDSAMGAFGVTLPAGGMVFRARTAVVAYLVGMLVTAAAAVVPAYKAATVPPIAALRDTYTITSRSLRTRAVLGVLGAGLGAAAIMYGLSRSSGTGLVGAGAVAVFLGVAALSPALAGPVTRLLGAPLPALFGTVGRIGLRNATRSPRRTAATASALMIGLALVSAFSIFGQSIKVSVQDTVAKSFDTDYLLYVQNFAPFSPTIAQTIAKQPGAVVTAISGETVRLPGISTADPVFAGDSAAIAAQMGLKPTDGGTLTLRSGQIAMDETRAKALGLRVGATVPVQFVDRSETLTVAGIFTGSSQVKLLISQDEWVKHAPTDQNFLVLVKVRPGADRAAVDAAVRTATMPFPTVHADDTAQFVAEQSKQVDQVLGLVYVLLALAVVIALFGIVNTLALSVIERTKEIGMLRAVGLRRGQMWLVVVLESVVIAVFGAALGVGVGSFLGWALVSALKSQGITSFAYPVTTIAGVLVLGGVLGVLAAVFPALRAARMNILRAIATA
jgi:putative ABC transport system permease protein